MVAMLVEAFFEEILHKDAPLRETVHALLYFDIDCTIISRQVVEVVDFDKFGREVADHHAHVFYLVHGCVEVEFLQVDGAIACILC